MLPNIIIMSSKPKSKSKRSALITLVLFPREALKELLRDKGVPSSANWESALKMIQKDARWVTFAKLILILILILTGFTPSTGRSTRT